MNTIFDSLPQLQSYQPALLSLTLLCLITLIQNFLTAVFAFAPGEQTPGMLLNGDHKLFSFRVIRTFNNSVENVPTFGITLIVAILVSVNSTFVNWISVIYILSRLAFWGIYYAGYGKVGGGPRTISFVAGLLANLILAFACILALLI